jgi:hypothetical protein
MEDAAPARRFRRTASSGLRLEATPRAFELPQERGRAAVPTTHDCEAGEASRRGGECARHAPDDASASAATAGMSTSNHVEAGIRCSQASSTRRGTAMACGRTRCRRCDQGSAIPSSPAASSTFIAACPPPADPAPALAPRRRSPARIPRFGAGEGRARPTSPASARAHRASAAAGAVPSQWASDHPVRCLQARRCPDGGESHVVRSRGFGCSLDGNALCGWRPHPGDAPEWASRLTSADHPPSRRRRRGPRSSRRGGPWCRTAPSSGICRGGSWPRAPGAADPSERRVPCKEGARVGGRSCARSPRITASTRGGLRDRLKRRAPPMDPCGRRRAPRRWRAGSSVGRVAADGMGTVTGSSALGRRREHVGDPTEPSCERPVPVVRRREVREFPSVSQSVLSLSTRATPSVASIWLHQPRGFHRHRSTDDVDGLHGAVARSTGGTGAA